MGVERAGLCSRNSSIHWRGYSCRGLSTVHHPVVISRLIELSVLGNEREIKREMELRDGERNMKRERNGERLLIGLDWPW